MKIKFEALQLPNLISLTEARVKAGKCTHTSIMIDKQLEYVICKDCDERLNPVWVLARYAREETRMDHQLDFYARLKKALEDKKKTKCKHCGKMTDVNVKVSFWE